MGFHWQRLIKLIFSMARSLLNKELAYIISLPIKSVLYPASPPPTVNHQRTGGLLTFYTCHPLIMLLRCPYVQCGPSAADHKFIGISSNLEPFIKDRSHYAKYVTSVLTCKQICVTSSKKLDLLSIL